MDGHPPSIECSSHPGLPGHRNSGPPVSQNSGINAQIGQIEGQPSVDVTVVRVQDLPLLKNAFGKKREFFVTVTNGTTTKKTTAVQCVGQQVCWNEMLGAFTVQPSSHLRLCIYAKKSTAKDIHVGTLEIPLDSFPSSSQSESEVPFILSDSDIAQQPTIYLKISVSPDFEATNTSALAIEGTDNPPANALSSQHGPHVGGGTTIRLAEKDRMLSTEGVLDDADQAVKRMRPTLGMAVTAAEVINTASDVIDTVVSVDQTWEKAVATMQDVMGIVEKMAEIHPYAKMAWSVLSVIPKTVLDQVSRDENVKTLLQDIHDVFDLAKLAEPLGAIKPGSTQALTFIAMLRQVCNCGDFIQSYAQNTHFWQRIMKSFIGQGDTCIENHRTSLFRLRDLFLNHATVTTEITVHQILDDMGGLSSKFDGISTKIAVVSDQVTDASLDAAIREISYAEGSSYNTEKGCLPGTRTEFLDFIINWANNPQSERALVLFGQAGHR